MAIFSFQYLIDAPIIDVNRWLQLGGNANGPALIQVPPWVKKPLARYYLYFAHHEGNSIRLALADRLLGPWRLSEKPAFELVDSLFPVKAPLYPDLHASVKQDIENGMDGNYPHIASPDVIIDEASQHIRLYYHGRLENGMQATRVAISSDGLNFVAQPEVLGLAYFRVFKQEKHHYAMAMPGVLYRSFDGLSNFEPGPQITDQPIRHFAFYQQKDDIYVFWTRVGDAPESILCSKLLINGNWRDWRLGPETEIHRPQKTWEGANQENLPSRYGAAMQPVNQLRDPAIYTEDGRVYLLYSVAGEQGIGIGVLIPTACD